MQHQHAAVRVVSSWTAVVVANPLPPHPHSGFTHTDLLASPACMRAARNLMCHDTGPVPPGGVTPPSTPTAATAAAAAAASAAEAHPVVSAALTPLREASRIADMLQVAGFHVVCGTCLPAHGLMQLMHEVAATAAEAVQEKRLETTGARVRIHTCPGVLPCISTPSLRYLLAGLGSDIL